MLATPGSICGLGFSVRKVALFGALIRFSPETNVLLVYFSLPHLR